MINLYAFSLYSKYKILFCLEAERKGQFHLKKDHIQEDLPKIKFSLIQMTLSNQFFCSHFLSININKKNFHFS